MAGLQVEKSVPTKDCRFWKIDLQQGNQVDGEIHRSPRPDKSPMNPDESGQAESRSRLVGILPDTSGQAGTEQAGFKTGAMLVQNTVEI